VDWRPCRLDDSLTAVGGPVDIDRVPALVPRDSSGCLSNAEADHPRGQQCHYSNRHFHFRLSLLPPFPSVSRDNPRKHALLPSQTRYPQPHKVQWAKNTDLPATLNRDVPYGRAYDHHGLILNDCNPFSDEIKSDCATMSGPKARLCSGSTSFGGRKGLFVQIWAAVPIGF